MNSLFTVILKTQVLRQIDFAQFQKGQGSFPVAYCQIDVADFFLFRKV